MKLFGDVYRGGHSFRPTNHSETGGVKGLGDLFTLCFCGCKVVKYCQLDLKDSYEFVGA